MPYPYSPESDGSTAPHTHPESDIVNLPADLAARTLYRGAWSNVTPNYAVNDLVTYRGGWWICTTANTATGFSSANFAPVSSKQRERLSPQRVGGWYQGSLVAICRTATLNLNRLYLHPCFTAIPITISKLGVNPSAGVASSIMRAGIYLPNGNDSISPLQPASWALSQEAGTMDTSTTGAKEIAFGTPVVIPAETWFYVAGVSQVAASTLNIGGNDNSFSPLGTQGSGYGTNANLAVYIDSVTGALPASVSGVSQSATDSGVAYYRSA